MGTFPLSLYEKSSRALVNAFANYSNNFSVTSKIQEVIVKKPYKNVCFRSRIIYSSERDGLNGISGFRRRARSIADCFADGKGVDAKLLPGYGGIMGATAEAGLVSYRVNEPRYAAPDGASLRLDAYCREDATLKVTFYLTTARKTASARKSALRGRKVEEHSSGCGGLQVGDGRSYGELFRSALSGLCRSAEVLVNNVLWI